MYNLENKEDFFFFWILIPNKFRIIEDNRGFIIVYTTNISTAE